MAIQTTVMVLLQFVLSCLFVSGLLLPASRLLGQGRLDYRRSLQCGIGFGMFQLVSVLLFVASVTLTQSNLFSADILRLGLVWVSLPLLLVAPVMISFTTGWQKQVAIASSTVITLAWVGLQYGFGIYLLQGA